MFYKRIYSINELQVVSTAKDLCCLHGLENNVENVLLTHAVIPKCFTNLKIYGYTNKNILKTLYNGSHYSLITYKTDSQEASNQINFFGF